MSPDAAAAEPRPGTESYWSDLAAQAERESEQGAARHYGMKAEEYAAERWDLIEHETGFSDILIPYDHPRSDREPPEGEDVFTYPGNRREIQVKGARLRVKDSTGSGGRAGRFRLWDEDHERLCERRALYLFLGYDPHDPSPVECVRFIPARDLDDAVDGLTWYDAQHSTKRGRPTDLSVKRIFPHL